MDKISFENKIEEYRRACSQKEEIGRAEKEVIKAIFDYYPIESFELDNRWGIPEPVTILTKINDEEMIAEAGFIELWGAEVSIDMPEIKSFLVELNFSKELFLDFCKTLFVRIGEENLSRLGGRHVKK